MWPWRWPAGLVFARWARAVALSPPGRRVAVVFDLPPLCRGLADLRDLVPSR